MTNQNKNENELEQLAEGLGIKPDSETLSKVAATAQGLMKKVNLDKLQESVQNVLNKSDIKQMLDKTDIDETILEKGKDLLGGLFGSKDY